MRQTFDPSLYFIVDPQCCANRPVATVAAAAIAGGVTIIQYRDKENDAMTREKNANDLLELCQHHNIPLLINDDVDLASKINADGVHIGQGDMDPEMARTKIGENKILGLTAFTPEHFSKIDPAIIDYTGTGPVYPTKTDKGKPVMGVEGLKTYIEISPVPVVAIGGITTINATAIIETKVNGIAIMRHIGEAERPDLKAAEFKALIKNRA